MEIIHQILIESVSGGVWRFLGYTIIIALVLGIPAHVITYAINSPLKHWTIRKNGYPPMHCDADGKLKE